LFAIGTTEFVTVGLLPNIAGDLRVSVSTTGLLVTAYALGIAFGGPVLLAATARWPRKRLLLALMAAFIVGNLACAVAPSFGILLVVRVLTSFSHAAFVAAALQLAMSLVDDDLKGRAIAAVLGGLTIALAVGVPLGTVVGQQLGWRSALVGVAAIGAVALAVDAWLLPEAAPAPSVTLAAQLALLGNRRLAVPLITTVLAIAGLIAAYTYITPFLEHVSGFRADNISLLLIVFGVSAAAGNFLAGSALDRWPRMTPPITLTALAVILAVAGVTAETHVGAIITLVAWGAAGFGLFPILQHQALRPAGTHANVVNALNISAANLGIAMGAPVGGQIVGGVGLHGVPLVGAAIVLCATVLAANTAHGTQPSTHTGPAAAEAAAA
jgi:DHA1 family inner membrane transport protein